MISTGLKTTAKALEQPANYQALNHNNRKRIFALSNTKTRNSQMEYKFASAKFENIQTRTVRLVAKVAELGSFTGTVLTIPLINITKEALEASDVLISYNITDATAAVPTIVGANLLLTAGGATTFVAGDLIDLVIRLK